MLNVPVAWHTSYLLSAATVRRHSGPRYVGLRDVDRPGNRCLLVGIFAIHRVKPSSVYTYGAALAPNRVYGLLPRSKRNAVRWSTRESVAVVYPASDVSIDVLVP